MKQEQRGSDEGRKHRIRFKIEVIAIRSSNRRWLANSFRGRITDRRTFGEESEHLCFINLERHGTSSLHSVLLEEGTSFLLASCFHLCSIASSFCSPTHSSGQVWWLIYRFFKKDWFSVIPSSPFSLWEYPGCREHVLREYVTAMRWI